jgi:two-component system sensor histidine kinase DesK
MMMRRDLHDQVDCSLAGMGLQLEFERRLIDTDTARADLVLADLRSDMTELIVEVRRILDNREMKSVCDVEAVLRSMIGRMGRAAAPRLEISLDIDPEVSSVLGGVGSVTVWMVREAVVNVLKHSTARHCSVSMPAQPRGFAVEAFFPSAMART